MDGQHSSQTMLPSSQFWSPSGHRGRSRTNAHDL